MSLARADSRVPDGAPELDRFFALSLDLMCIAGMDGYFKRINPAVERILGFSEAELLAGPILDLIHPEDREATLAALSELVVGTPLVRLRNRCRCRDGSYKWLDWTAVPHGRDFYAVGRDVTAQQAAEEVSARLAAIVESSADAIIGLALDGTITSWNRGAQRLYGYSADEIVGQHVSRLIPTARLHEFATLVRCVERGERVENFETVREHKDGRQVDVALSVSPIVDTAGRLIGAASIGRAVTERKEAERQLERLLQAEKLHALGQMASGIAHDLNQSLLLVASYGDLAREALERDPPDLASLREACGVVARAARDGGTVVQRLLTFARDQPDDVPEPIDLRVLLSEVAQLTAPRWRDVAQAEGRPISLDVETAGDVTIDGSAAGLREALTNLIFNAIDALPQGGTIRLTARRRADEVVVEVADTGVGMPADVQAQIFEPFFSTKGERGTGLGLAQVLAIVDRCSGRLGVESAPGRGTTFSLTFPSATVPRRPAAGGQSRQPDRPARPLRVLAVDDEPTIGTMVTRALRPDGHTVIAVTSGEHALAELTAQPFDVLLSDLGLGLGMNGWDLVRQVRARWPTLRIVLATGWGAGIDAAQARAQGVNAVIAKPYGVDQLRCIVAAAAPNGTGDEGTPLGLTSPEL